MLFHLLTLIKNNLRSNLLLMAGLFIVSTALWYAVDYVYTVAVNGRIPLGFEWRHVYYVEVGVLPEESAERDTTARTRDEITEEYLTFYDRVQRHAAVESACYTAAHFHYVWKNTTGSVGFDTLHAPVYYRYVTPSYFTVFRVKGADGCSPEELTRRAAHTGELVVTENAAARLLPPAVAATELAGKFICYNTNFPSDTARVAAVCENQKYNEYTNLLPAVYNITTYGSQQELLDYEDIPEVDLFIRVKAEADGPEFARAFRQEMKKQLRVGNLYLADMRPMSQYRDLQLSPYRSDFYTYLVIAGFFLVNAFLAVLGTFWFRTQERTEELAIRMVTGATPRNLQRMLLGEGFLLVTFAYIPALVVAYRLGVAHLVQTWPVPWSVGRFMVSGGVTYLLLLGITAASIGFPARQIMKLHPVEALHGE